MWPKIPVSWWALTVTIVLAAMSASWALSAEVHNYRLSNITTRLGTQEVRFLAFMDEQAAVEAMQERRIDHNETMLEVVQATMQQIQDTQAEILREIRNGL